MGKTNLAQVVVPFYFSHTAFSSQMQEMHSAGETYQPVHSEVCCFRER